MRVQPCKHAVDRRLDQCLIGDRFDIRALDETVDLDEALDRLETGAGRLQGRRIDHPIVAFRGQGRQAGQGSGEREQQARDGRSSGEWMGHRLGVHVASGAV